MYVAPTGPSSRRASLLPATTALPSSYVCVRLWHKSRTAAKKRGRGGAQQPVGVETGLFLPATTALSGEAGLRTTAEAGGLSSRRRLMTHLGEWA